MRARFHFLFLLISAGLFAQPISIGSWNSYLSYANQKYITRAQKMIYVGGSSGLFSFNTETDEVQRINTIHGLSELDVALVRYDPTNKALFVGYESTNIDILFQNGEGVSSISDFTKFQVSDVYRYSVVGTKTLHDVFFQDQWAYVCTSFGIIVYDMQKREVKDSYLNIGPGGAVPDVLGLTINDNKIYASTNFGVMEASLNASNLSNNTFWKIITDTFLHQTSNNIVSFNNKVYAVVDSTFKVYDGNVWNLYSGSQKHSLFGYDTYNNQLLTMMEDSFVIESASGTKQFAKDQYPQMALLLNDNIWFIKKDYGLIGKNLSSGALRFVSPSGPRFNDVFSLNFSNNKMWVMGGKYSPRLEPAYSSAQFYTIENYTPTYYPFNGLNYNAFDTLRDCAISATSSDGSHTYIGTFNYGLIELVNGSITNVLGTSAPANFKVRSGTAGGVKVLGLAYDADDVLWAVNFLSGDKPIYCRLADGTWKNFTINGLLGTRDVLGKVVIDHYGTKWIRTFEGNGLLAFKENDVNNPFDVNVRLLNDQKGQGALASKDVQCVAVDNDGEIWIGTGNGISVISSPSRIFDNTAPDSRTPYVREGSVGVPLLQYEMVTAIEIDGANRKWIGTRNGLWLFNSDGSKALKNFNVSNSPLFSNIILDLELNPKTGELFIATDKGLIVYKTDAVEGGEEFGDVYAYPNPVRPGYMGPIAIKGLISDCIVKITDMAGNLVYETISNGGQAVWDGNDFSGNRASSGIYIVFASNKDGTKHFQTKIAFVN
ncbi:MAG: hypothetical protein NTW54_06210 [Bacteroidetes bacterium]|nr:hypothetical protein [Bacteroidota bacterium]